MKKDLVMSLSGIPLCRPIIIVFKNGMNLLMHKQSTFHLSVLKNKTWWCYKCFEA
jgi:hypothetical protein